PLRPSYPNIVGYLDPSISDGTFHSGSELINFVIPQMAHCDYHCHRYDEHQEAGEFSASSWKHDCNKSECGTNPIQQECSPPLGPATLEQHVMNVFLVSFKDRFAADGSPAHGD